MCAEEQAREQVRVWQRGHVYFAETAAQIAQLASRVAVRCLKAVAWGGSMAVCRDRIGTGVKRASKNEDVKLDSENERAGSLKLVTDVERILSSSHRERKLEYAVRD